LATFSAKDVLRKLSMGGWGRINRAQVHVPR